MKKSIAAVIIDPTAVAKKSPELCVPPSGPSMTSFIMPASIPAPQEIRVFAVMEIETIFIRTKNTRTVILAPAMM